MSKSHFQTIVVGAGALGSATAYNLGQQGQTDVLVLEQFALGHSNGASNDHSRIIRHSYHHDNYGRLTRSMYDAWERLERASGQRVFVKTGGLDIGIEGTRGADIVENYRNVMRHNGIPFQTLDKAQLVERFPQWEFDEPAVRATYQADSGLIDIRLAVQTHIALAQGFGATILENSPVRAVESYDGGARVVTDDAVYTADKVVLCVASWADQLLHSLGVTWTMTISQEQVIYLSTPHLKDFAVGQFPVFGWHGEDLFYGFPTYGEAAIKVSRDMTGRFVTQETRTFEPVEEETARLLEFVRTRIPKGLGRELYSKTCIYDMAPDRDFVLDFVPGHDNVIVGNGAGHAGKFAALLGEILAELATTGTSRYPIEPFRADRTSLMDPAFTPVFALKE